MTSLHDALIRVVDCYKYDANGRLTSLTGPSGTFSFIYDSLGRRTKLIYPNKVVTTYGYDAAGQLTSLVTKTGTNKLINSYNYTLDKAGNRLSKTEPSIAYTYTYDGLDRLLKSLASVNTRTEEYSYDSVGNRLSGPLATTRYTYGGANQLLSDGVFSYQYDNNGNMISRSQSGGLVESFMYYDDNRLLARNQDFYYDAFGRRVARNNGCIDTFSSVYSYDGDNVLHEDGKDGTMSYITRYTHNLGVDDVLAMERGGVHYYYHKDALGSVTSITDKKGNVVQTYDYDSFGNIVAQKSTTFVQPYTYTSREWDKETGLYYYRARYYDPMEGRFIQKDPIGFKGGINLYAYVQNNPVRYRDPYGLIGVDTIIKFVLKRCAKSITNKILGDGLDEGASLENKALQSMKMQAYVSCALDCDKSERCEPKKDVDYCSCISKCLELLK